MDELVNAVFRGLLFLATNVIFSAIGWAKGKHAGWLEGYTECSNDTYEVLGITPKNKPKE